MLALILAAQLVLTPRAPISTDVIRSAPGMQTNPDIASNGEELFAVWEHGGDVIGSRLRLDGTAIDTNLGISLQPTWLDDRHPSVVWNGESWVVVFFSGPLGAKLVEVNRGGEVITELRIVPDRDMASIDVAWNGSQYLLVWREHPSAVRAQIFDRTFAKVGEELAIADRGFEVSVASNGGGFLIAWTDAEGTYARAVSNEGVPAATTRIDDAAFSVDVASNGISYAVFARDLIAVDADGTVGARTTLPQAAEVAIAARGANWILAWGWNLQLFVAEVDAGMRFVQEPWRWPLPAGKSFPAIGLAGERALLLFSDFSSNQYEADIRSAFIDEPSTTHLVSSGLMHQEIVDAAWSASTLGVLWYESERAGAGLRFGELSAGGVPLRGEGILLADGVNARLASNGTGFAAVVVRGPRIEVDLLPAMRTVVLDDGGGTFPLIASDGRDYYAVWSRRSDLVGRRVGADGSLGELHTFAKRLSDAGSVAQDIVWTGTKYVVLTYESYGFKYLVTYTVTATEVSAGGVPGMPIVLESADMTYAGYQGRLGWNGETLLYARSAYVSSAGWLVRARAGLDGPDVVVAQDAYVELHDVVWDRGEWLYAVSGRLLRGEESIPLVSAQRPRLAAGQRTAVVTSMLVERIPNHADQSVRRGFVMFLKTLLRRRAVR